MVYNFKLLIISFKLYLVLFEIYSFKNCDLFNCQKKYKVLVEF